MSIQQKIDEELKAAMRAKDAQKLVAIRMVKAKMGETITAKGFAGTVDDALWLSVIGSYIKAQEKALEQFVAAGVGDSEPAQQIRFDMAYLAPYLPSKADEATQRAWVDEAVAALGGKGSAKLGQVMGSVMKAHKDEVDAALLRSLIEAALR